MRLSKLAGELLASIRERRCRSAQQSYEEGAQINRRLQELLAVPTPTENVEVPPTNASTENEPDGGFPEPFSGETRADFN
jgi:hypothetical protein